MMKHTPGPWHRNIRAVGKYPTVFAGRNQHVATVAPQSEPEETEANIDLIAAAPDLLEALTASEKAVVSAIDRLNMFANFASPLPKHHKREIHAIADALTEHVNKAIRAALAKARGQ